MPSTTRRIRPGSGLTFFAVVLVFVPGLLGLLSTPRAGAAPAWLLGGSELSAADSSHAIQGGDAALPAGEPAPFRIELLDPPAADDTGVHTWSRDIDVDLDPFIEFVDDEDYPKERFLRGSNLGSSVRYNRVEGLAVSGEMSRSLNPEDYLPAYQAALAYAFAPQRGLFRLALEQPVAPRNKVTVGASAFRRHDTFFYGREIISDDENSLSALFFHRDYRDWFEAEGVDAWIGLNPSPFFSAAVGLVSQDEAALGIEADWSVFRQTRRFRPNPAADQGTYRAYTAELAYNTNRTDRSGWRRMEHAHRLQWERADKSLDGDFDLWRVVFDTRTYWRLSHAQSLSARILAGTGSSHEGPLPPQRRFALGGIGTLRGHNFGSLQGDHLALANLQYEFEIEGATRALVFVDAGQAWDEGNLVDQEIAVDVGAGVRLGENGLSFILARNVNRSDADVKAIIRFQDTF